MLKVVAAFPISGWSAFKDPRMSWGALDGVTGFEDLGEFEIKPANDSLWLQRGYGGQTSFP
jgi:hypothetical protein